MPENFWPSFALCPLPCSFAAVVCEREKKILKFKMCAQFTALQFRQFFSFKLTFVVLLETRTECGLKISDVFYRFFDDFDLKDTRTEYVT